jgi:hypothetical protein
MRPACFTWHLLTARRAAGTALLGGAPGVDSDVEAPLLAAEAAEAWQQGAEQEEERRRRRAQQAQVLAQLVETYAHMSEAQVQALAGECAEQLFQHIGAGRWARRLPLLPLLALTTCAQTRARMCG